MQRIFLIGYMGAGKTTIGRLLSKALGLEFIDLDHFIEKRYNKSISQLFADNGEENFRQIEARTLEEISNFENIVISTGGGAPCFHNSMEKMNIAGTTIYLKASAQELTNRLNVCKNSRPLIKDKSNDELLNFIDKNLQKREVFYNQANIILDIEHIPVKTNLESIISQLINMLNSHKLTIP